MFALFKLFPHLGLNSLSAAQLSLCRISYI